jgi:hypothetical protein
MRIDSSASTGTNRTVVVGPQWKRYGTVETLPTHTTDTVYVFVGQHNIAMWGAQLELNSYPRRYSGAITTTSVLANTSGFYTPFAITIPGAITTTGAIIGATLNATGNVSGQWIFGNGSTLYGISTYQNFTLSEADDIVWPHNITVNRLTVLNDAVTGEINLTGANNYTTAIDAANATVNGTYWLPTALPASDYRVLIGNSTGWLSWAANVSIDSGGVLNATTGVIVGDNAESVAGTIKYNTTGFYGYNGTAWNKMD